MGAATYEVKANINVELTKEDIEDIMVCALEQGIGYWACLDNTGDAYTYAPEGEPVSITCVKGLLAGKDVRFEDTEDESEYILNLDKFLNGFRLWIENGEDKYGAVNGGKVDTSQIDADMADLIVQYAIFGEVVFG